MRQRKSAQLVQLERELAELQRQRNLYKYNESMSSVERQRAVGKIDTDIAAKKAQISQLNTR